MAKQKRIPQAPSGPISERDAFLSEFRMLFARWQSYTVSEDTVDFTPGLSRFRLGKTNRLNAGVIRMTMLRLSTVHVHSV